MDWFDSWALSLATFIPMVGMAVVLAIPKAKEALIKQVTLLTTALTLAIGVIILFRFDYDAADEKVVEVVLLDQNMFDPAEQADAFNRALRRCVLPVVDHPCDHQACHRDEQGDAG